MYKYVKQYKLESYNLHVMLYVCYGVCFLTYLSVFNNNSFCFL